ncbi:hypothetical protein LVD15_03040 [Fulvivirga maritima]|uniref:tetratricopeptide repeat protein n=1 Tax=Fulvivirga maritima TaxID=2904247 RepID=UPI001F3F3905|nr:hypothetical protein [Fulvivirga maritima]UII27421.1 hypothetical protein LVD15_03040 [Fulvivirga maritima]
MKRTLIIGLIFLLIGSGSFAQLNLPEDESLSREAQSMYALFSDNFRADNLNAARKPLEWLLENTPGIHESIYINGIKLYQELADKKKPAEAYEDSVLIVYDLRMEHFNNEKDLIDRKASASYKYLKDRPNKEKELFEVFEKTYKLNGTDVGVNNLAAYMDVIRRYNAISPLSDDEVLTRYYKIMDAIDAKSESVNEETLEKIRSVTTKILLQIVPVNCDFIREKLAPRIATDQNMMKRVFKLAVSEGCTSEPFFFDVAKEYIKVDPNPLIYRILADHDWNEGKKQAAMEYYNKAIEASTDASKKADLYFHIAVKQTQAGNKIEAKNYAEKALATDGNYKKAYKLIGDLYYNSFNDCKKESSKVADRSVYWAAYDMYEKAGDTDAMKNAAQQFPTIEDIFNESLDEGKNYQVACWINRSTIIRRNPN